MNMRIRLVLAFTLVALVAILSVVVLVRQNADQQVRAYMYRGGMVGAEGLVTQLESYYSNNGGWQGVEFMFQPHMGQGQGQGMGPGMGRGQGMMMGQRIRIASPSGRILYDSDESGKEYPGLTEQQLKLAIPLESPQNRVVGYLMINDGQNILQTDARPLITRLNEAAFRAAGIALAIGLVLALLLAAGLLRPVRNLTIAAEHLSAGDLNTRVPVRGNDEMATLAKAFNVMTESLQASEERRKAMTADIAHELRTPLSVQRAHLEALQDGIYPLTSENLQPVFDQNEMLTRLVEDLRTLALVDAGELPLEQVLVDLNELVSRSLDRFRASAEARQVTLVNLGSGVSEICPQVLGDPVRLEQILNNLLANALRHAPLGGQIEIGVLCQKGWAELRVHDTGPGIASDALPHVFERFYRADKSRSRDEGGSGLGLAIARQLAIAHGGTLIAENDPRGGAVFILRLPVQLDETDLEAD